MFINNSIFVNGAGCNFKKNGQMKALDKVMSDITYNREIKQNFDRAEFRKDITSKLKKIDNVTSTTTSVREKTFTEQLAEYVRDFKNEVKNFKKTLINYDEKITYYESALNEEISLNQDEIELEFKFLKYKNKKYCNDELEYKADVMEQNITETKVLDEIKEFENSFENNNKISLKEEDKTPLTLTDIKSLIKSIVEELKIQKEQYFDKKSLRLSGKAKYIEKASPILIKFDAYIAAEKKGSSIYIDYKDVTYRDIKDGSTTVKSRGFLNERFYRDFDMSCLKFVDKLEGIFEKGSSDKDFYNNLDS